MKKRKPIVVLFLMFFMISTSFVSANSNSETIEEHNHDSNIEARYIACPGGGKHKMTDRGDAEVYLGSYPNKNTLLFEGFTYRCKQCGLIICSENNVNNIYVTSLGRYVEGHSSSDISFYGTMMWIGSRNEIYYNSNLSTDDYTRGMEFGYTY